MKISKQEVDKMIKEEFQKMWKKRTLSKRLEEINESLKSMENEDSLLNEVEASGMQKTSSETGLIPGEQPKPKFEKLNATTLKEDEIEGADMGLEISVDAPADSEMGGDAPEAAPMGEFEAKFAELGKFIDAKLASDDSAAPAVEAPAVEMGEEPASDDFEEVQVDAAADEPAAETGETGAEDDEKEEFDEVTKPSSIYNPADYDESGNRIKKEEVVNEMEETEEEGIDGKSVVQQANLSDPDGDMKKDTVVSESTKAKSGVINEVKKTDKKNIFLEGKDPEKQAKFLAEQKRMRKFAGLSREEDEE